MTSASSLPEVAPGTIAVWSDLLCPFSYVALRRLTAARTRLGVNVPLDHHVFPLELFNGPHPRRGTDTEAVGLGHIEPGAHFRVWTASDDLYPHTVLLAAEAVLAAKAQSLAAGEALDLALRRAFWTDSLSISHRQVILAVATEVAEADGILDVDDLTARIDHGAHRAELMADYAIAQTEEVGGSPTFVLPGGTSVTNPGITVHWEGPWAAGFPVVDSADPDVYDNLLLRATA
ncbi:DsbA family oxidoreductase [Amycolatopsis sp. H20-H5]|uniref:DsbA family oxidoreductase n=1 Tax=Amycolatopsis sp. H20-H5 TaxID=3046309 RepID=UPI002DB75F60|nr:DsbA family protein [Amycolatopsis sp. H20-H5]MEC3975879.1 DsbA family protein [Amycolatopsis sp. H20-H5]